MINAKVSIEVILFEIHIPPSENFLKFQIVYRDRFEFINGMVQYKTKASN